MPSRSVDRLRQKLRNEKYCIGVITDRIIGAPKNVVYYPQLARYYKDPEAYVSNRTEIKRLLKKRGWRATGIVDYDPS